MALNKSIELENGIITTYHNISELVIRKIDSVCEVRIGHYLTEQGRIDGKKPVINEYMVIPWTTVISDAYANGDNLAECVYNYLKTLDKYADSIDV